MNDQQRATRIAAEAARARSQRMRVVTGLFAIAMIVGLATVLLSRLSESVASTGTQSSASVAAKAPDPQVEPLTELGVAPETKSPAPSAPQP
jgi:flagellar biogenesis protein FliO